MPLRMVIQRQRHLVKDRLLHGPRLLNFERRDPSVVGDTLVRRQRDGHARQSHGRTIKIARDGLEVDESVTAPSQSISRAILLGYAIPHRLHQKPGLAGDLGLGRNSGSCETLMLVMRTAWAESRTKRSEEEGPSVSASPCS